MSEAIQTRLSKHKNLWVFIAIWLVTCALYLPAGNAGWVIDGVGFLYNLKHQSFWDFINRTSSEDQSFYQLFTLHYYVFYKLFGMNMWLWSILYITAHAAGGMLFFRFSNRLLADSGIKRNILIPVCAAILFSISPHISEIIACRAYFHYLLAFIFMMLILIEVQGYQHDQKNKHVAAALAYYILAAFTLEIFYLIPFLVITIGIYYRYAVTQSKNILRQTIVKFCLPQLLLLAVYFIAQVLIYKNLKPHKIEINSSVTDYLSKLPKYLFHIVTLGRYFPKQLKDSIYTFFESPVTLTVLYGVAITVTGYCAMQFKKMSNTAKVLFVLFVLSILNICFVSPLPFPGSALLVFYDRYAYFAAAFIYLFLVLLVAKMISNRYVIIGLLSIYVDLNLYYTIKLNTYWLSSDAINTGLLRHFPNEQDKTVLLLNIPENMEGAPMIGAQPEGFFKLMREVYTDTLEKNNIYDVASYNMVSDYNGANVKVMNDSTIIVTLNHTGTWWWYEGHGAKSYETADYKVNMKDPGRWYELTLKHPSDQYLLLYSVGDKWKKADLSLKNVQQD